MNYAAIRKAAAEHPSCGNVVYIDAPQCAHFGSDYYADKATCVVAASTLLRSADYDQTHRDLLEPLGAQTLVLERKPGQNPGWFTITSVFPA